MPVFDIEAWKVDLKTKYPNISDDDLKFDEIRGGFLRLDKFSQSMQALDKEKAKNDDYAVKLRNAEEVIIAGREKLALIEQYEEDFGPAENWSEPLRQAINVQHPELNLTTNPKAVEEIVAKATKPLHDQIAKLSSEVTNTKEHSEAVGRGAAVLIDFMGYGPKYWEKTYGEEFPGEDFAKAFNDPQNSVKDPKKFLQLYEIPRKEKKQKEDFDRSIKEAEDRGYQRGASKAGVPYEAPGAKPGLFFTETGATEVDPVTGKAKPAAAPKETSIEEHKARVGGAFFKAHDDYNRGKVGPGGSGAVPGS